MFGSGFCCFIVCFPIGQAWLTRELHICYIYISYKKQSVEKQVNSLTMAILDSEWMNNFLLQACAQEIPVAVIFTMVGGDDILG